MKLWGLPNLKTAIFRPIISNSTQPSENCLAFGQVCRFRSKIKTCFEVGRPQSIEKCHRKIHYSNVIYQPNFTMYLNIRQYVMLWKVFTNSVPIYIYTVQIYEHFQMNEVSKFKIHPMLQWTEKVFLELKYVGHCLLSAMAIGNLFLFVLLTWHVCYLVSLLCLTVTLVTFFKQRESYNNVQGWR